jgi:hypothetical protein
MLKATDPPSGDATEVTVVNSGCGSRGKTVMGEPPSVAGGADVPKAVPRMSALT